LVVRQSTQVCRAVSQTFAVDWAAQSVLLVQPPLPPSVTTMGPASTGPASTMGSGERQPPERQICPAAQSPFV
jgi:hypothetical protein